MKNVFKKGFWKRGLAGMLTAAVVFALLPAMPVKAASKSNGTATLRIISTTDMHGQIGPVNYDTASEHYTGSVAQVYTLIKNARSSLKYGNTLTVDVGDTVYGYSSDHIKDGSIDSTEYMYQAMSKMGYDAMTLGNHEFDYGYEYIKEALEENGLDKKMIVSNVYDAKTKKNIWAENMVVTKTLNTTTGKQMNVRIGIIGVTIPVLSAQYNHTGLLETDDMIISVNEQVEKLKAKNVDLIIVLAHTGLGRETDEEIGKSVGYAMSMVDGVDAIIGGHSHQNFPSADSNVAKYYDYEGVSEDGLVNGKVFMSVADRAVGIGIADIKLQFKDGKASIIKESAKIKKVTASTVPDETITKIADRFQKKIDKLYNVNLGETDSGIDNYFGTIEDNAAIQAVNEAKIQYGIEYVQKSAPEYASCPVIAASGYQLVGKESADDYIHISDQITVADSLKVQNWDRLYSYVYYITGAQLREWMEYRAASAYQQTGQPRGTVWNDKTMYQYIAGYNMISVLSDSWLDAWDNFMVFDGIEYEVDPTQPARYNVAGKVIDSSAHRISKLTCNGVAVTDKMKFILVTSPIQSNHAVLGSTVYKQKLNNERIYNNTLLQNYVKQQCAYDKFNVRGDQNWKVNFPEGTNYVVKSSSKSQETAETKPWYVRTLTTNEKNAYYQVTLGYDQKDTCGPTLVAGVVDKQKTGHDVRIAVQANDVSGIASIQYYNGMITADSNAWTGASQIKDSVFTVTANGVYSIRAKDCAGNVSIRYITVANYDKDALEVPVVTRYTNRNKEITGTAEPGTTLHINVSGANYSTEVKADGTFSYELPLQNAGRIIKLWVQSGSKKSDVVSYEIERTGPNYPNVSEITNKDREITGFVNDSGKYCRIIAIADNVVYVPEDGGMDLYLASELFEEEYKVVPVKYEVSDGYFELSIPVFNAGTEVKVYSLDWIARRSVVSTLVTADVAPNMPKPYQVYAMDDYVYGKIPNVGTGEYNIIVSDGTDIYTATAQKNGFFAVQVGKLKEGQSFTVKATDTVNDKTRTSAAASVKVASYKDLLTPYTDISFETITNKDTQLRGHISDYEGKVNLLIGDQPVVVTTDKNGYFSYTLKQGCAVGTTIAAMIRYDDGTVGDVSETTVALAIPDEPEIIDEIIYDTAEEVKVFAVDQATAVVKVGTRYNKCTEAVYDKKRGGYVYTVKLKKSPKADSKITVFMMNAAGKSKKVTMKVEADPTVVEEESEDQADQTTGNTRSSE